MNAPHLLLSFVCSFALAALSPMAGAVDMAERVKPCEACHGSQGRAGPDGYYPRLAGKPAGYLYNQMENFSQGRRRYHLMRRMMEPLSPQYQLEMAEHFASLQVPYLPSQAASRPTNSPSMVRGRQLAIEGDAARKIPACNSCHGNQLMGQAPHVPSLLGLPAAYLGAQLSAWTQGERSTAAPDCMADIAKRLTAEDAAAVTAWLAAQVVPNSTALGKANTHQPSATNIRCGSAPNLQGHQQ
jgi:cytochrome c553